MTGSLHWVDYIIIESVKAMYCQAVRHCEMGSDALESELVFRVRILQTKAQRCHHF